MTADKIKSIVSKKANGDSTISAQLYQMFFLKEYWIEYQRVNINITSY